MANEVFLLAREGLAGIVSARVADRVLASAMRSRKKEPETIDAAQMRSLLMGPVLRELQSVLPRSGLRRNLELLSRTVDNVGRDAGGNGGTNVGTDADGGSGSAAGGVSPDPRTLVTSVRPPGSEPVATLDPPAAIASLSEAAEAESDVPPTPSHTPGQSSLSRERWSEHVARFAQIEHIQMVSVISADGETLLSRGEGPDLDTLCRLARVVLSLLGKAGRIRSMQVSHSNGELFLYPLAGDLLVLFGAPGINLGSVSTTFASIAFEEDL